MALKEDRFYMERAVELAHQAKANGVLQKGKTNSNSGSINAQA